METVKTKIGKIKLAQKHLYAPLKRFLPVSKKTTFWTCVRPGKEQNDVAQKLF